MPAVCRRRRRIRTSSNRPCHSEALFDGPEVLLFPYPPAAAVRCGFQYLYGFSACSGLCDRRMQRHLRYQNICPRVRFHSFSFEVGTPAGSINERGERFGLESAARMPKILRGLRKLLRIPQRFTDRPGSLTRVQNRLFFSAASEKAGRFL